MAMLLRSLRARVINRGARNFRAYADLAVAYEERVWESNGTRNRVVRMPSGPAVVITPWNAPFMLSTWKTAPALAAGCTVILKPAEWSPLSCSLLCDLVAEARLPPGSSTSSRGSARRSAPRSRGRRASDASRSPARRRRRCTSAPRPRRTSCRSRASWEEGPAARLRRRRPRGGCAEGGRAVRRRGPGVPGRNAAPRRGGGRRRVPRAVRPLHRRARARRPPRRRDDRLAAHPSRPPRARGGGSSSAHARTATRSSAAAGGARTSGRCSTTRRSSPRGRTTRRSSSARSSGPC